GAGAADTSMLFWEQATQGSSAALSRIKARGLGFVFCISLLQTGDDLDPVTLQTYIPNHDQARE
ncbi:MAG: hypothetical protein WA416_19185, partial [Candidatus Sulfotelmatobacter sp.]